jgi:hypothetical protein
MKHVIIPVDGSAPVIIEGVHVTPQNRSTYATRHPELSQYVFAPTGATAGVLGAFTPADATPPANLSALQAGSVTASPATAWTTGQGVKLGDETTANWTGSAWAAGAHA